MFRPTEKCQSDFFGRPLSIEPMEELDIKELDNKRCSHWPCSFNDLWKNLLPTPPHSPKYESQCSDLDTMLSLVSEKLDNSVANPDSDILNDGSLSSENLQANLIQDCMWSAPGLQAAGLGPEKMSPTTSMKSPSTDVFKSSLLSCTALEIDSGVCVDPAAVFPYPLNDRKEPTLSSCIDTPSESEDTDDDDDSDATDEEIDVVSVAGEHQTTVQQTPRRKVYVRHQGGVMNPHPPPSSSSSSSMSAQVAAMHNYSSYQPGPTKLRIYSAPRSPPQPHHIPSASSTLSHTSGSGAGQKRAYNSSSPHASSASKRQKLAAIDYNLKKVAQKLKLSQHQHHHQQQQQALSHRGGSAGCTAANSRSGSDSEDGEGKRAQHNVLERKRRNDLKSHFQCLRERVPEISTQERAPKVVILRRSVEYICKLQQKDRALRAELEQEQRRRDRLRRRLAEARQSL